MYIKYIYYTFNYSIIKTDKKMSILNVTFHTFRNEIIGKIFQFADDTSVSVDIRTNEVYDMDGMCSVPDRKKTAIEKKLKTKISL